MPSIHLGEATIELDDDGEGLPVLMLHGFPTTHRLWSRVAPVISQAGFRTLVPDLVGYGASRAPRGARIDMASQANWMLALLDELGVEQAAVVSHDVGSAAAQIMVSLAPRRLRGLVVMDGVYGDQWAMESVEGIRAWDPANAARLLPLLSRRLDRAGALREVLSAYAGEEGGLQLIRAARDFEPEQTASIVGALRGSGVPSLVVWGESDSFFSVDEVARPLAQLLSARLVTLPGGHFLPVERPIEVAAILREFLSSL